MWNSEPNLRKAATRLIRLKVSDEKACLGNAMQLSWEEWFLEIVIPAWQAFLTAEQGLTNASQEGDDAKVKRAGYIALREGGAAAFYVHHFAEVVACEQPSWLPVGMDESGIGCWLGTFCTNLRTGQVVQDVSLLCTVANALKHASLRNKSRQISTRDDVVVTVAAFGKLNFGTANLAERSRCLCSPNQAHELYPASYRT